jgi:hypothetical protein
MCEIAPIIEYSSPAGLLKAKGLATQGLSWSVQQTARSADCSLLGVRQLNATTCGRLRHFTSSKLV